MITSAQDLYAETREGMEALIVHLTEGYGLERQNAVTLMNRNPQLLRNLANSRCTIERTAEDLMRHGVRDRRHRG